MDTNISKSPFQLIGTSIRILTVENNFVTYKETENSIKNLTVKYDIKQIDEYESYLQGIIHLITELNAKVDECEFKITLCLEGCFYFDSIDKDMFENMLKVNGSSALYSISRSIITSVMSQSFSGEQIILPMLNFVKMSDSKE